MDLNEAFFAAQQLYDDLVRLVERDPEQEVQGAAVTTVDAVLVACREFLPNHSVLSRIQDVISPEAVEAGEPIRVADMLPVVGQVKNALSSARSRRMAPPTPDDW